MDGHGGSSLESLDLIAALVQSGADESLAFDGRLGAHSFQEHMKTDFPLVPIPPKHFQTTKFDVPMLFDGTINYNISTYDPSIRREDTYRDIHLHDKEAALQWLERIAPEYRGQRQALEEKRQLEAVKLIQSVETNVSGFPKPPVQ